MCGKSLKMEHIQGAITRAVDFGQDVFSGVKFRAW